MRPFRLDLDPSYCAYSNVGADGYVLVPPTGSPVLVATIPLTTGPVDMSGLRATPRYSLLAASDDGSKVSFCEQLVGTALGIASDTYEGGSPPLASSGIALPVTRFSHRGGTASSGAPQDFAVFSASLNMAGDLEVSIAGRAVDAYGNAGADWYYRLAIHTLVIGAK